MRKMSKHEDWEALERKILPWLKKMEIPLQDYWNLSSFDKVLLHNLVCTPTYPTSHKLRMDLYRKLCSPGSVAGRDCIDPVGSMPDEELRKFFSPVTPSEGLSDLEKY